ncbi:hypothetical protein [Falsiroseomonas ponticola]|uniref:hypothetical protein n=1 Tax=Falsiroseomonas ponticola TaxID=2786951 RepID=UPI001932F374|nr:hypothetical protein [Roseomonas ponticola]
MSGRKTDYFGTFLESYKANTASTAQTGYSAPRSSNAPEPVAEREPPIDAVVKIWPQGPGAEMSVIEVAKTFGTSLSAAASALRSMENIGLAVNRGGTFVLTELGKKAASFRK